MKRLALFAGSAVAIVGTAQTAIAECEGLRPTDDGGYFAEDFAPFSPAFYDAPGGLLRIHYVTTGPSAVDSTTTPPNPAPDSVVAAGVIGEEAVELYTQWGFASVRSDAGNGACASNGGDDRIDVYFVDFGGGDGHAVTEECAAGEASSCSGYVLVEAAPVGYPSHEIALRTIVPHEIFHLVQASYTGTVPPWLAEGTAQWAADKVHPALTDLEAFVPAYAEEAHRSIDSPPGGAAAAFLYGTAVWPVFVEEQHGLEAVRAIFEAMADGAPVWEATDAALADQGGVAAVFPRFAAGFAGSGERALSGGFVDASKYEAVQANLVEAPLPGVVADDVLSGFAIRVFEIPEPATPLELALTAPNGRVAALVVPLSGGRAQVDLAAPLPAQAAGPAFVVVAGTSPSKQDAPFRVEAAAAPSSSTTSGEPGTTSGATTGGGGPDDGEDGCTVGGGGVDQGSAGAMLAWGSVLFALRARGRRKS